MIAEMTAASVRSWIAEINETKLQLPPGVIDQRHLELYRTVLKNIAENQINPSPTRATAEAALEL